jgi:hypothetical protein
MDRTTRRRPAAPPAMSRSYSLNGLGGFVRLLPHGHTRIPVSPRRVIFIPLYDTHHKALTMFEVV